MKADSPHDIAVNCLRKTIHLEQGSSTYSRKAAYGLW